MHRITSNTGRKRHGVGILIWLESTLFEHSSPGYHPLPPAAASSASATSKTTTINDVQQPQQPTYIVGSSWHSAWPSPSSFLFVPRFLALPFHPYSPFSIENILTLALIVVPLLLLDDDDDDDDDEHDEDEDEDEDEVEPAGMANVDESLLQECHRVRRPSSTFTSESSNPSESLNVSLPSYLGSTSFGQLILIATS
ncbi:hypothetical protein V1478_013316 [Vespula squamosa]|uniref:Uncharacterized protein n=1 Tax=Vespula squamosa TaxID=30214 RepID=A0ABD2AAK9_VESSQ